MHVNQQNGMMVLLCDDHCPCLVLAPIPQTIRYHHINDMGPQHVKLVPSTGLPYLKQSPKEFRYRAPSELATPVTPSFYSNKRY
ncbi:hypothetical protein TNCV_3250071 [Trichonephila clavipes]|nr:hypothetical protein TNCV_3250071 [Trichonephila clavipes]